MESRLDPAAASQTTSALGLMQITTGAVATVNATTPAGIHFEHADMTDEAKAISCGTHCLAFIERTTATREGVLFRYKNGPSATIPANVGSVSYVKKIIAASECLRTVPPPLTRLSCLVTHIGP